MATRALIRALAILAAICTGTPAGLAQMGGGIQLKNAWSRPALAGHPGVAYLTITDSGTPDRLIGASTPVAASAGLHQSRGESGVTQMRPVASLAVAPGEPTVLAPGAYHIMLMGLKQPLVAGQTFPLTLTFANSGAITTTVTVRKFGVASSGQEMGGPMEH